MRKETKTLASWMIALVALLLVLPMVSAFGVSSSYWEGYPLTLYPGASSTVNLNLQNKAGATEDVVATVQLIKGSDVTSFEKQEYTVKAGESLDVPVQINIPSDAEIGKTYDVSLITKTSAAGQSGSVAMSTGMITAFQVVVGEAPASTINMNWVYGGIAIVIVVALIIYFLRRKK